MTGKKTAAKPTAAELEILQVLWEIGPTTVRTVNDRLNQARSHAGRGILPQPLAGRGILPQPVGYTTTLKLMQIMHEKGLLRRDESSRSHLYTPALRAQETRRRLLDRFVQTAFGGSAAKLVLQALANHSTSQEEISEIREFLDRLGEEKNGTSR